MKILLLDLGNNIRGGQRQVFYLARHLSETSGFSPLVALPRNAPLNGMLTDYAIPTAKLHSGSDIDPLTIIGLIRLIHKFQPDVIHTNDAKGASLAALAKTLIGNFKLIHSRRVSYPLKSGWSTKKYAMADAVVAVSREIEEVLHSGSISPQKTSTIHSGIDATRYSKHKSTNNTYTIGAIGALSTQKGFSVLLEALSILNKTPEFSSWKCIIAGDGPSKDALYNQSRELKLTSQISFVGFQESAEILTQMDVLVVPSVDGEGSNAVIKEGWVSQTPLISSDLKSNLELVTHKKDALVFKNKNAIELAAAIKELRLNKKLAQSLIKAGAVTVQNFTDASMAKSYMNLYRRLF